VTTSSAVAGKGPGAPAGVGGTSTGALSRGSHDPPTFNRAEWLAARRKGIGGSDIAAVVGLSPWRSPVSVFLDKVAMTPLDDDPTPSMQLGRDLEPVIAAWFGRETGLAVAGEQMLCTHPARPWALATIDGLVMDPPADRRLSRVDDALGVFEAKYDSGGPWDEIPVHYQCQGQWELFVTGLPTVWFAVMHLAFGHPNFRVYELARNVADIELLAERAERFWADFVIPGVMPPTDGRAATTAALGRAWGHPERSKVELDDDFRELVRTYALAKARHRELGEGLEDIANTIRAALGSYTDGLVDGELVASWRSQGRTSIDAKALRKAHPDIAEQFTLRSEQRVLRTHLREEAA
jgi:putative phage-type endonuclease